MAPPGSAHLNFTLGGLVALGGTYGYLKKGSKVSLGAGLVCGSLLVGSGVMISGEHQFEGHALATATNSAMALGMGHRWIMKSGKMMPAGMVAIVGAIGAAYNAKKAIDWL
mmetsp:Transcript_1511/g.2056  ORF Transcript_1511/g.2056 Transcript_1511/m.2056 type:complete len:111 (+) Transcript_1511:38-370(+)